MSDFYPPVGFHFRVEFGVDDVGDSDIFFREVSGLNISKRKQSLKVAKIVLCKSCLLELNIPT